MHTCILSHRLKRWNVMTSMVGLKNGHIRKNLTQNGETQRYSWGTQKKKKKNRHIRLTNLEGRDEVDHREMVTQEHVQQKLEYFGTKLE